MAAPPLIASDHVISLEYELTDDAGVTLDSNKGGEPLSYLHGHGQIVPGLERALTGKAVGDQTSVTVSPEDGYGARDEDRLVTVGRDRFDFEPEAGQVLEASLPQGGSVPFVVVEVTKDNVVLDGNHPLAGKTLHFDVKVVGVRPATATELEHEHVHDGDGHDGHHHHHH